MRENEERTESTSEEEGAPPERGMDGVQVRAAASAADGDEDAAADPAADFLFFLEDEEDAIEDILAEGQGGGVEA